MTPAAPVRPSTYEVHSATDIARGGPYERLYDRHYPQNPWNAVYHDIPDTVEPLLLHVAYWAADYCSKSEYELMQAARRIEYIPAGYEPGPDSRDVHEEVEDCWLAAIDRVDEIARLTIACSVSRSELTWICDAWEDERRSFSFLPAEHALADPCRLKLKRLATIGSSSSDMK